MRKTPLVSIIMGVYNCEKTVDASIQSILNQTYEAWEFIICDDCSQDETYDKLLCYQEQYPDNFVILRNEANKKLAATLNRCLSIAKGKYIARMDGDDLSMPSRLGKQVEFLENNPEYDVVGTSIILFDDNGDKGYRGRSGEVSKHAPLTSVPFTHPTIMMTAKAYQVLGGYCTEKWADRAEDKELWFRFFAAGFHGYNLEEPLFKYYENLGVHAKKSIHRIVPLTKLNYRGYKALGVPKWKYIFILKSAISLLTPNWLIYRYHKLSGKTKATSA